MVSNAARFWSKVKQTGGCWEWTGGNSGRKRGYGRFRINGGMTAAHRQAWKWCNAREIPNGLCVLHTCDNPPCVNPLHLFLGSQRDNVKDMDRKGRANRIYGEKHSRAKLTAVQVAEIIADTDSTCAKLAAKHEVCRATISHIRNGRNWKREANAKH